MVAMKMHYRKLAGAEKHVPIRLRLRNTVCHPLLFGQKDPSYKFYFVLVLLLFS